MRLYRLRRTVALFICPELEVVARLKAARETGYFDGVSARSYRFKSAADRVAAPKPRAEFPVQAESQSGGRMTRGEEDLSQYYQNRLTEMRDRLHAAPAEPALPEPASTLRDQARAHASLSDRAGLHLAHEGDQP